MFLPVVASSFWYVPAGLLWAGVATLNFWIWRRSKSAGHLVMLGGSAWLTIHYLLATFDGSLFGSTHYDLQSLVGSALVAVGFYLTVRPLVAEEIRRVRRFVSTKFGKNGLTPTIPYAPASASAPATPSPAPVVAAPSPASTTYVPVRPLPARPVPSEILNLR